MSPHKSLETASTATSSTGADWAQSLAAGQAMTVGFNALSGEDLSGEVSLRPELLIAPGTELMLL